MFGASRFTIREAPVELRTSALVASRRGSGTVVLRRAPHAPVISESYQSIDAFLASVVEVPLQLPTQVRDDRRRDKIP
jgi:GntR family transcriptional regulator